MKKSLIALAALATVGAAQAQSSVTLYGALDAGYSDMSKTVSGVKSDQQAFTFSNYTTSRWGVRGTEDLGGGLRASFNIESTITPDVMASFYQTGTTQTNNVNTITASAGNGTATQATNFGDRAAFATISNASGTTVGIGFASTAVRDITLRFDAAGGSRLVGNLLTMDAQLSSNRATGLAVAQKLGSLTVRGGISQNNSQIAETAGTVKSRSGFLVGFDYAQGPVEFAYARQEVKSTTVGSGNTGALDSDAKQTIDVAGASYLLGKAKLFASYANIKVEDAKAGFQNATAVTSTTAALFTGEGKRNFYALGASAPVGKADLFATYSAGKIDQTLNTSAGIKRDMTGYTVGARYNLSKRTFGYAAVGKTKIDGTSGNTNELKVDQVTAGVAHSF